MPSRVAGAPPSLSFYGLGRRGNRSGNGAPAWVHPIHLSLIGRRILSLLHEVLGKVDPDSEQYHRLRAEVFDVGYAAEYGGEFVSVEPELTGRDCEFVWDVLDMFVILKASMDEQGPDVVAGLGEHAEAFLTFGGFDLSDPFEGRLLS